MIYMAFDYSLSIHIPFPFPFPFRLTPSPSPPLRTPLILPRRIQFNLNPHRLINLRHNLIRQFLNHTQTLYIIHNLLRTRRACDDGADVGIPQTPC
jgi:hypothetical protein